jgi:response regulator RpfG family c-di-GMP phosphodiesterase
MSERARQIGGRLSIASSVSVGTTIEAIIPSPPRYERQSSMRDSRISILCLDDDPLVREGIILKIDAQPDMKVVASAATGEEALELFWQHRPNVTLVDLQLPTISGLDVFGKFVDGNRRPE